MTFKVQDQSLQSRGEPQLATEEFASGDVKLDKAGMHGPVSQNEDCDTTNCTFVKGSAVSLFLKIRVLRKSILLIEPGAQPAGELAVGHGLEHVDHALCD